MGRTSPAVTPLSSSVKSMFSLATPSAFGFSNTVTSQDPSLFTSNFHWLAAKIRLSGAFVSTRRYSVGARYRKVTSPSLVFSPLPDICVSSSFHTFGSILSGSTSSSWLFVSSSRRYSVNSAPFSPSVVPPSSFHSFVRVSPFTLVKVNSSDHKSTEALDFSSPRTPVSVWDPTDTTV